LLSAEAAGGAYRALPDPLAVLKGPISKGRKGNGKVTERGRKGKVKGKELGREGGGRDMAHPKILA